VRFLDFRLILRVGSGFCDLNDSQINLSGFEEGSRLGDFDQVSTVKSKRQWKSVKSCRIDIASPVDFFFFFFFGGLSESREIRWSDLESGSSSGDCTVSLVSPGLIPRPSELEQYLFRFRPSNCNWGLLSGPAWKLEKARKIQI
jgi:hypothetical protein